ncbi:uncharacterized protein LOC141680023 [Apium graveolens]|uniref:uncharacterized protein LOC141680023 n=1 Tax=Apium graveolens TaxID=4045 RepID=UPI003D7AD450
MELIPYGKNEGTDELAKLGSRRETTLLGVIPLDIQRQPSVPEHEINSIGGDLGQTWMAPIMCYVKEVSLSDGKNEARRIRYKVFRYVIYDGILYRTGFSVPLLKCIDGDECSYILRQGIDLIGELSKAKVMLTMQRLRKEMREFCEQLGIQKSFNAASHPQSNRYDEAVNKIIKHTLKAKLEQKEGTWPDELPHVLWSYNTTSRTTARETLSP